MRIVFVFRTGESRRSVQGLKSPPDDELGLLLIIIVLIGEAVEREQGHEHLLGSGQPRGMMQGYGAAVRHHAVDELHAVGVKRHGAVALMQFLAITLGKVGDHPIEDIVLMNADHPQAPSGGPEILRIGIDQNGIVGSRRGQRFKLVNKGSIDIIGEQDEILALGPHQLADLHKRFVMHGH